MFSCYANKTYYTLQYYTIIIYYSIQVYYTILYYTSTVLICTIFLRYMYYLVIFASHMTIYSIYRDRTILEFLVRSSLIVLYYTIAVHATYLLLIWRHFQYYINTIHYLLCVYHNTTNAWTINIHFWNGAIIIETTLQSVVCSSTIN